MKKLRIAQEEHYQGRDHWTWSVWLEGDGIKDVKDVVYCLHPTFAQPLVTVDDRASNFRLDRSGWGEFSIRAEVRTNQGATRTLKHNLKLTYDSGTEPSDVAVKSLGKTRVFISYSSSDAAVVAQIREALNDVVELVGAEDVALSSDLSTGIAHAIRAADSAIVVLPERVSPWMEQELKMLKARGIETLPILVHKSATIPKELQDLEHVDLTSRGAKRGMKRIVDHFNRHDGARK